MDLSYSIYGNEWNLTPSSNSCCFPKVVLSLYRIYLIRGILLFWLQMNDIRHSHGFWSNIRTPSNPLQYLSNTSSLSLHSFIYELKSISIFKYWFNSYSNSYWSNSPLWLKYILLSFSINLTKFDPNIPSYSIPSLSTLYQLKHYPFNRVFFRFSYYLITYCLVNIFINGFIL